jgi:hypothetical protein
LPASSDGKICGLTLHGVYDIEIERTAISKL